MRTCNGKVLNMAPTGSDDTIEQGNRPIALQE